MRPLKLGLKGFTAFRHPAEIDFTELDVFAISGPTGSGKSSLLDAMTYALYGRVERVGDLVRQLISHGQPRMAVTLEFEVGTDRYRVTRSTPSARGATKILLERFADGEWRQAGEGADRVREAEPMIARAIGLTYDGFTRSVLLPQGKFAEFLVGEAKKRRDILTELLGLSLFRRMAERAGTVARESSVRAQERTLALEREYADATPEALEEAKRTAREAKRREKDLAVAARHVLEILGRWQEARRSAEELRACSEEARRAADQARAAARELAGLADRLRDAEAWVAETVAASTATGEGLEVAQGALREAEKTGGPADQLAEARIVAHRLGEAVRGRNDRDAERADSAREAKVLAGALDRATTGLAERRAALAVREGEARDAEGTLEEARHADLVAAVSAGLKAGDPCPVCGLPLKKAPRKSAAGIVERAQTRVVAAQKAVEAERKVATEAERARDGAARDREANRAEQRRLAAEIDQLDRSIEEARAGLLAVLGDPLPEDPVAEIERRVADRQRLDQVEREAARRAAAAVQALSKAEQERDRVQAQIERQRDRLTTDHRPLFDRATRASGGRIEPLPLPSPPDADPVGALLSHAGMVGDELVAFAERLAEQAHLHGSLEDRLLREATEAVGDLLEPASTLEALAAAVDGARRTAAAEVATAAQRAEDLAIRVDRKKKLAEEVKRLQHRGRLFKALALELRADRLIAFLQADALQVLALAGSARLSNLSEGRYRLLCREDEFLVVDTWNGDEERSVRTLSGGETFLASLALALALADQVRSLSVTDRARLDSLFLDEGFGTLDPETLRTVTDAIEQLAGDGRLVGVITHVRELAEQFPRIEVRKDRTGSMLEPVG